MKKKGKNMNRKKGFTPTLIEDEQINLPSSLSKTQSNPQLVSGFTLIELTVSFTIFIALISLTTLTFTQTLQTRRVVGDLSASMSNIAFVTEQMAREIRTGTDFKNIAGEETIRFTNANNEQVGYKKITNGIGRCAGSCGADLDYEVLTSPDVKIDNLKFILKGTERGDDFAPRITIIAAVAGPKGINVPLQTTISARVIDLDS